MNLMDLPLFQKYSIAQIIILAVVFLFILGAALALIQHKVVKTILVIILINIAFWYFVFGIEIHSFGEFVDTFAAALKNTYYLIVSFFKSLFNAVG